MKKRSKIGLEISPVDVLVAMSEGNPGAISVLTQICDKNKLGLLDCLHLDDMNMRGPQIWVAFKDICDGDIDLLIEKIKSRDKDMISKVNAEMLRDPAWKELAVPSGASWR